MPATDIGMIIIFIIKQEHVLFILMTKPYRIFFFEHGGFVFQ